MAAELLNASSTGALDTRASVKSLAACVDASHGVLHSAAADLSRAAVQALAMAWDRFRSAPMAIGLATDHPISRGKAVVAADRQFRTDFIERKS